MISHRSPGTNRGRTVAVAVVNRLDLMVRRYQIESNTP